MYTFTIHSRITYLISKNMSLLFLYIIMTQWGYKGSVAFIKLISNYSNLINNMGKYTTFQFIIHRENIPLESATESDTWPNVLNSSKGKWNFRRSTNVCIHQWIWVSLEIQIAFQTPVYVQREYLKCVCLWARIWAMSTSLVWNFNCLFFLGCNFNCKFQMPWDITPEVPGTWSDLETLYVRRSFSQKQKGKINSEQKNPVRTVTTWVQWKVRVRDHLMSATQHTSHRPARSVTGAANLHYCWWIPTSCDVPRWPKGAHGCRKVGKASWNPQS